MTRQEELARTPGTGPVPLELYCLDGRAQCELAWQLDRGDDLLHGRPNQANQRLRHLLVRRGVKARAPMLLCPWQKEWARPPCRRRWHTQ
jgi:hypothetical protein